MLAVPECCAKSDLRQLVESRRRKSMGAMDLVVNELQSKFGISGGNASTLLSSVLTYINDQGTGLRGVLDRFKLAGLGDSVSSWLSGTPKAISAENVESALGSNTVSTIASRAGLSTATTASALAFVLPKIVQRMAPGGQIPTHLPAEFASYISGPTAAVASRAREVVYATERTGDRSGLRRLIWPIIGLVALLFLATWLWNRSSVRSGAFNADEQVRLATQRSESALSSLKSGFSAQDLTSALNLDVINFASGSAEIPQGSDDFLNKAAAAMKSSPAGTIIEIGGHTDTSGDEASNFQLSQARADAVRTYLVNQGVDPAMLVGKGYGDTKPLSSNNTDEGRFRNRRIEFTVVK
jgi:outer membrane protein OmpA-like peptidoglycan-associated protein/uncharacterized protein YidB (DUF937 family)